MTNVMELVEPSAARQRPSASPTAPDDSAPATAARLTIAYLTSLYARSSDTFIRGEVEQLRRLGHAVHTFSIREPGEKELISDDIRREHANTDYLLSAGKGRLVKSLLSTAFRRPGAFFKAAKLAMKVGWPGVKGRLWPFAYLLEAAYLAEQLQAKGIQHLHNHLGEGSAAVAMLASAISGVPYSLTIHGSSEWDEPKVFALGEKLKHSAFVAVISEYTRSQLCRWSDLRDWPKIHIVRCGVNPIFLETPPSPVPAERRVVCIGRLVEAKGLPVLVEAARRLASENLDFELVLVGDGPLRPLIERQIQEHRLEGRVRIVGYMTSEQVRDELVRSRALVLPSFAEGLPVVIMEALALGRPVIGTHIAAIPELVEPGACGWLVPPGSADHLADALRDCLTADPERLARMGRGGAARVAERHDQRKEAGKLAEWFVRSAGKVNG